MENTIKLICENNQENTVTYEYDVTDENVNVVIDFIMSNSKDFLTDYLISNINKELIINTYDEGGECSIKIESYLKLLLVIDAELRNQNYFYNRFK